MKSTTFALVLLAAVSCAEDAKPTTSASETASDTARDTASSPATAAAACIKACKSTDTTCRAECTKVPSPSEESIALHNECIAECNLSADPTGCQAGCVAKNFMDYTRPQPVEEEPEANATDAKNATGTNATAKGAKNGTKSNATESSSHAPPAAKFNTFALGAAMLAAFCLM